MTAEPDFTKPNPGEIQQVVELLKWRGEWAHNGQPERAAEAWLAAGFTPNEIGQWLAAGVSDECLAAFLARHSCEPAHMNRPSVRILAQWFLWRHERD